MNTSRRNFIKIGALTGIFTGTNLLTSVFSFAQEKSAFGELPSEVLGDPFLYLTAAEFRKHLDTEFSVLTEEVETIAVLSKVTQIRHPVKSTRGSGNSIRRKPTPENFVLSFRLPKSGFPQATSNLRHTHLGQFDLFLVPGSNENDENLLHAVINRI